MPYLDVAIVGIGAIGLAHVDAVRKAGNARLAALVDVDLSRVEPLGRVHGVPVFDDLRAMLDAVDVDVVVIATPDAMHVEPVSIAAEAGKHVLLEKPLATTIEDGRRILDVVGRTGITFSVGHCLRFDPKYVHLREAVASGTLGTVASIYAKRQNKTVAAMRLQGRVSSLLFLGVHDFDILNWCVGSRPTSVYAASRRGVMESHGRDVDDLTWTTVRYENGSVGVVESGWLLPANYPRSGHFELVVTGDGGVARLDEFDEGLWVASDRFEHVPLVDRLTPQIESFVDDALAGREPLVSGQDAFLAMEIALAAENSARLHEEVALSSTAVPRS